jgi:hypothetical protein
LMMMIIILLFIVLKSYFLFHIHFSSFNI